MAAAASSQANRPSDGDFLVIRPSQQEWVPIEALQRQVSAAFGREKITWSPTDLTKAHFTLFKGLNGSISDKERTALMQRLKERIKDLHTIDINFSDKTTKVKRGPGKWVTLQFESKALQTLAETTKKVVRELLQEKVLAPTSVRVEELEKQITPHMTLGVVEEAASQQRLNDIPAKKAFGVDFKKLKAVQAIHTSIKVNTITLMGVQNLNAAKAADKEYVAHMQFDVKKAPENDATVLLKKLRDTCGNQAAEFTFKAAVDDEQKPTLKVMFARNEAIETLFANQLHCTLHYHPSEPKTGFRLGLNRFCKLFGDVEGPQIYKRMTK